ncbi:MAG: hypothetical protein WCJ99_00825 [Betaproteobacteria bacterium]
MKSNVILGCLCLDKEDSRLEGSSVQAAFAPSATAMIPSAQYPEDKEVMQTQSH